MAVASSRSINNSSDTSRKFPTTVLAARVLTATEGTIRQRLAGAAASGTVTLAEAIAPGTSVTILAFVAASGAPATKCLLDLTTDYTVLNKNSSGVGVITCVGDQSANTLIIDYSPDQAEGTIGGQSTAS